MELSKLEVVLGQNELPNELSHLDRVNHDEIGRATSHSNNSIVDSWHKNGIASILLHFYEFFNLFNELT